MASTSPQRQKRRPGCSVDPHRGRLRLRYRLNGKRKNWPAKNLPPDTPENRRKLKQLALVVGPLVRRGIDPTPALEAASHGDPAVGRDKTDTRPTIHEYYSSWIEGQVSPMVRKAQQRDYRQHIVRYILPVLGDLPVEEVTRKHLEEVRKRLLRENPSGRKLSAKTVRNIMDASLRAMLRDAREIDKLLDHDPFAGMRWPRYTPPPPNPLTERDRDRVLEWFANAPFIRPGTPPKALPHPPYHAYVRLLFWTGMRESEGAGLRWGDVDLDRARVNLRRSRYLGEDDQTKSASSLRIVDLDPETTHLLASIRTDSPSPDEPVFLNTRGAQLNQDSFSDHWNRCLRELGIEHRGLYQTKHTYLSLGVAAGVPITRLSRQTGVSAQTILKNYAAYVPREQERPIWQMIEDTRSESGDPHLEGKHEKPMAPALAPESRALPRKPSKSRRPRRDLNPCYQRERLVSLAKLDDGVVSRVRESVVTAGPSRKPPA